jgi:serine/threonine protein kinase
MESYEDGYAALASFWYMEPQDPPGYRPLRRIASGQFGDVWFVRGEYGEPLAMKTAKLDEPEDPVTFDFVREYTILRRLNHPHIIPLYPTSTPLRLVFPYISHTLMQCLSEVDPDTIALQLKDALRYAHSQHIVHRDLKPHNILVRGYNHAYISDWGLGYTLLNPYVEKRSPEVVSLWYRAPEVLEGKGCYGFELDYWALGCIWYEMCMKTPLFQGDSEMDMLKKISGKWSVPDKMRPLLHIDPHLRVL